jgi:hypothetical protein
MQHLNSGFNKFKVYYSTHVKILIVQETWKNSLTRLNIIAKHCVAYVSIYYNKNNMQLVSNIFNKLKVNGLTHVHMLITEEMWKFSLICFNINVGFEIVICVLINYGKCKMQFISNGFIMLKSWWFNSCTMSIVEKMFKKSLTHYNALFKES